MSYSDYKTVESIREKFKISVVSGESQFSDTMEIPSGNLLTETLKDSIPLALNINTEKARSELIICPVLMEVRRLLHKKISLFSGVDFNVDENLGLSGYCDFILSNSPDQIFIDYPVVCIVEAKNENIRSGYGQCIAEMIAARIFNDQRGISLKYILGVVTTGSNWRFLKYEDNVVTVDYDEYLISQVGKILGIFVAAMNDNADHGDGSLDRCN